MLEGERPLGRFERMYLAVGERLSRNLYVEVAEAQSLGPRLTVTKIAAFALAALVHLLTLGVAIAGVLLVLRGWPAILFVLLGLLALATAWLLRPRVPRLDEAIVPREQLPSLYALADQIAGRLGARPVDGIVVIPDFNAALGRYGLRGRRILFIGLPLFLTCEPDERVALLGHELAHAVNGDANRGIFVGTALNSLQTWHYLVHPGSVMGEEGGLLAIASIPYHLFLLGVAKLIWLAYWLLSHLLWRDSQRAEYLADHLAATVSGTQAMRSMLEKLYLGDLYERTVQNVSVNRADEMLFETLRARTQNVSIEEREAIAARLLDDAARPDVTHPPTPYRIAFLQSRPTTTPAVVLDAAASAQIDQDLTSFHAPIRRRILDAHRRSLEVYYS